MEGIKRCGALPSLADDPQGFVYTHGLNTLPSKAQEALTLGILKMMLGKKVNTE